MEERLSGLHIRLVDSLFSVIEKAVSFNMPIFQCFLTVPPAGKMIELPATDIRKINGLLKKHFKVACIHVSYHANACNPQGFFFLKRELRLATKLGFTHAVLHPGSGKWCGNKEQGITVLVEALNSIMATEKKITIVLENAAHGGFCVGGDFEDFLLIIPKLKYPERVKFCIDTAHAYSYGYDIADEKEQDRFIELLEKTIGIKNIALIHLNDTTQLLGKHIDQHAAIGQGTIGLTALKRFALHPLLKQVPVILELPLAVQAQEKELYEQLLEWQ